ncbi:hypothetical protein [Pararhizobium sp. O133]|uniref:hypothetical protein n=1 Tax=Pararhizobium sp. O133 TaxID=3449278 RepID=UPI003F688BB1
MANDRDEQVQGESQRVGAIAEVPFDRLTVERFREAFPRARWSDATKAWFVPGKTASRRIGSWLALMEAEADAHADEKGRDAYDFEPIVSPYLEIGKAGFRIRTPYSRTVVDELRQVSFARWDGDLRIWHVPFRSFEDLRRRWPTIEAAAMRNEPDARKAHRETARGSEEEKLAKARSAERRKRRHPVPADDPPPFDRPIATSNGIVVFTGTHGEFVEPVIRSTFYPAVASNDLIFADWRRATLEELVATWPARTTTSESEHARGWWFPVLDELRPARREARRRERRASTL